MSGPGRWSRYWFREAPVLDLAVVRILVVGLQLAVLLFPHALLQYPPYTLFEHHLTAFTDAEYHPPLILRALTLPLGGEGRPTLALLEGVYGLTILYGVPALIGLFTRSSVLLFALGNAFLSAHAYSYDEHHHIEALTVVFLLALPLSSCGAHLSVDRWQRRRRAAGSSATASLAEVSRDAGWPLVLMRWMFSLCYLSGALCKLGGGGLDWLNGYTMQYYLLQDGLFWETGLGLWLGQRHLLCVAMGWFTLLAEGLFFLVLLRPRLALLFVPALVMLHLGIYAAMRAPFFHYLPLFAVFVPWSRCLGRLRAGPAGVHPGRHEQGPATRVAGP